MITEHPIGESFSFMKLKTLEITYGLAAGDRIEKRILLTAHQSTESLKREIRRTILSYAKKGWSSYQIFCRDQFLYLEFEGREPEMSNWKKIDQQKDITI